MTTTPRLLCGGIGLLIGYWSQDKLSSFPAQRVFAWFMLIIGIAFLSGVR